MFEELHKRMNSFWNNDRTLSQTDPEFIEFFSNFAYDEVVNEPGANHPDLDDKTRSLAILAVLVGCQGLDAFEMMLPVAYETGLSGDRILWFRQNPAVPEETQQLSWRGQRASSA